MRKQWPSTIITNFLNLEMGILSWNGELGLDSTVVLVLIYSLSDVRSTKFYSAMSSQIMLLERN